MARSHGPGSGPPRRLAEEGARDLVPVGRHGLQLGRRLFQRDVHDAVAVQRGHPAEAPLVDEIGGLQPIARGEDSIARRRRAAALDVPEPGDPGLEPGAPLDVSRDRIPDPALAEPYVAELVHLALVIQPLELVTLGDDDDREILAAPVALLQLRAHL